jgi:hypothetical protein
MDMREALVRFQQDIWIVGAAAFRLHPVRRCALECAARAFENAGNPHHGAWAELVVLVGRLPAFREKFPPGYDGQECARLRLFVEENTP